LVWFLVPANGGMICENTGYLHGGDGGTEN